jgi:hypothetical protein
MQWEKSVILALSHRFQFSRDVVGKMVMKNILGRFGDAWYWGGLLGFIYFSYWGIYNFANHFWATGNSFGLILDILDTQRWGEQRYEELFLKLKYGACSFIVGWGGRYVLTGYKKINLIRH